MVIEHQEKEQFYADVVASSDVLRITIPKKNAEALQLKPGDRLKVWTEKVVMEED